jgi:fructose-1,6-bisphosphatase/inositol monophosphatase family enzyme
MLVASGRAQAMIDPIINHWDISAPSLIVREADGRSTTLDGSVELGADHISARPEMHRYILERFEK